MSGSPKDARASTSPTDPAKQTESDGTGEHRDTLPTTRSKLESLADLIYRLPSQQERGLSVSGGPIIAVDLDDVLCDTSTAVLEWHNKAYGTNLEMSTWYYYYVWMNPGWGPPAVVTQKFAEFDRTNTSMTAVPVPGAHEGVRALQEMGYRLVVVTAREPEHQKATQEWLDHHFPNVFEKSISTGFLKRHKNGELMSHTLLKAEVCQALGAQLLIDDSAEDDSAENAFSCVKSEMKVPVLLFGDYPWNKRLCTHHNFSDDSTFDVRFEKEGGREFWIDDEFRFPEDALVWRVNHWVEVVSWITAAKKEGRIL